MLLFPLTLRNVNMMNYYTQLGILITFHDNFLSSTFDQSLTSTFSPRMNDVLRDKCGRWRSDFDLSLKRVKTEGAMGGAATHYIPH